MTGACGRDVDDSEFRPINFDHNGLVLEVGVIWEQGVEGEFLMYGREWWTKVIRPPPPPPPAALSFLMVA